MAVKNERLEVLRMRLDEYDTQIADRDSLDERRRAAAQNLEEEDARWEAEKHEILVLANKVGPALTAMKEKLLGDTETYLDARDEYAQLDEQYGAILRRARAAGIEGDVPLIPSISADAARMDEHAYRIRRIVRRLAEVRAW